MLHVSEQCKLDPAISLNSQQVTQDFIVFTFSIFCQSNCIFRMQRMFIIFPENKIVSSELCNSIQTGKLIKLMEKLYECH